VSASVRLVLALAVATTPSVVAAHQGAPEASAGWLWTLAVVAGLVVVAWLYARGLAVLWRASARGRGVRGWEGACFAGGWLALALALASPLDALGEHLFAAHMIQHEILMLVAAPLLVLGRPLAVFAWGVPKRSRRALGRWAAASGLAALWRLMRGPTAAWTLNAVVLWTWHAPVLFDAAVRAAGVHALQHLSFLVAALAFWRAALDLHASHRPAAVPYVFTTALHSSVLGALLTFAPAAWYSAYATTTGAFGLTPLEDQQLGGLVMWIPAGLVYLGVALALVAAVVQSGAHARRHA